MTKFRASGYAEDLDSERPRARSIELRHQNPLPLPQHDLAAADLQRQVVAEQQRTKVRVGVHAIAVGMIRMVVQPLGVARHHLLEKALDVGEQRRLEFVDEQRTGRVHRPEADQPLADVEPAHEFHDAVGEIDQLDALIGLDHEGLTMNRKAADHRAGHLLDRRLPDGDSRTLAHALPLRMRSEKARTRTGYVTRKLTNQATPVYSRARAALSARRADNPTLAPAATRSGCKARTVPPL